MNKEQKRIAIAEACGAKWEIVRSIMGFPTRLLCFPGKLLRESWDHPLASDDPSNIDKRYDQIHHSIPDYLNDLNAMHDAEEELTVEQQGKYLQTLELLMPNKGAPNSICPYHATASQRAEAFLRTIGKWKD